ncbi:hypothetical protein CCM_05243 [Cordyceps militaris CM01]|uniref:Uncharacterized protein n=2 Tax=Cordyceps militaris TaxID=73501 RepID=G3JII5_CORMM|nr:uncharacterized protein CCM_05243 [Cordyceps militaris CM01]ATY59620.1 hypothetical protein A9K55_002613 [Cordyceps militaris]EGX91086.1 hypothetical protein CCM_05243 [Cordyceps militaris CM01]
MHVLNGFSSRRKTPKPRDLHIRKISFSGCSLSSGCSIDSASSTSTARGPSHHRSGSDASIDPLRLHPIAQPPPRLHERAYITSPRRRPDESPRTFFHGRDTDSSSGGGSGGEYGVSVFEYDDSDTELDDDDETVFEQVHTNSMPPMTSPLDHDADESDDEDYFFMQLAKRPRLPRSHWSESTIQTLAQLTPATSNRATPVERLEDPIEQARMMLPNFSYKHSTVPARPRMRAMDSVEHLVKLGGWKRKAVVLDKENGAPTDTN